MNAESDDLEDTHLCIKCNATIVGLSKYIEHRKQNCLGNDRAAKQVVAPTTVTTSTRTEHVSSSTIMSRSNLEHSYDGFHFAEPEAPSSYLRKTTASHGGKTSKSLTEAYDPTYELGADVFFSSLQLQSVSTGGKTGARPERGAKEEQSWHSASSCSDPLLKAMREHEVSDFKPLKFVHSPEASEEEEDDDEPDDFDGEDDDADHEHEHDNEHEHEHDHDADEDYDARHSRHSPPTVPATHTGGKWKPEHRPQLRHTHLERISPSWDEAPEDPHDHPPAEHTHGKWVPGSKQLEYRENIDLTKLQQPGASYWCNICCRRLKTRLNYEQHLRSGYHQRRAEAECQLEQANLEGANLTLTKDFEPAPADQLQRRRRRRANLLRCELCRHSMARHLMGKHLISHYHYRRLQQQQTQLRRQNSLHSILEHMGSIVRQAPFQCLPCRFYANTEHSFQAHWRSSAHMELTTRLGGSFWCSYCQFECASNEEMWQHLLGNTHMEVLFAINRSVPVCIAQRRQLSCSVCSASFLYNVQLRRHFATEHAGMVATGSASDDYQCRFRCGICGAAQRSRVALQRHEKHKHRLAKYYCALCRLEFETPLEARRHRSLMQHKRRASRQPSRKSSTQPEREIEHMLREVLEERQPEKPTAAAAAAVASSKRRRLVSQCASCQLSFDTPQALIQHRRESHPMDNHACLSCGLSFQSAQALGRHTRSCQPIASSSTAAPAPAQSKYWDCDQCSFSAQYESDLLYHRFFHTRGSSMGKDELLQCPLCPKQFRKHSLRAHLRNHTDERIFECAECLAKFARRHNLKNHMATMHGHRDQTAATKTTAKRKPTVSKTKFQCGTCGKILAKKYSLKLHEMSHASVERQFRCQHEDCSYAGLTPEALKTHLISHAKGSHKCEHENCNYVGKSELHLKRHLKSHAAEPEMGEGGKWFSCDQCEFRARIKGHLNRHMRRHTGEKPHQCPHCDFQCSSMDNLRKHIVKTGKHPGKFIYECSACADAFKSNSFKEYQIHLTTHKKSIP
ncbi:zinc finger protein Xfin [Drosophila novamexicana]|uniref:zinc finger protein Xfin n=1 Tax=Drosophila novamexicana TaxID=47314 RepID=UPI0011E5A8CA|nr:zinc finger protein Xfin [Drosophila novamexicana]